MFAVIKTGGKQYRVEPDDVLRIEKLDGEDGDIITFDHVLMVGGDGAPVIGAPLIEGASVAAEITDQGRTRKIIVFKKKRRHNYRRKHGHRQYYTSVKITEILTDGAKPSGKKAKAAPKKAKTEAEDAKEQKTTAKKAADKKVDAKKSDAKKDSDKKAESKKPDAKKAEPKKETKAKADTKKADTKKADTKKAATKKADEKKATSKKDVAKDAKADDLTALKGVGPAAAKKMNEAGLTTYAQIAALSEDDISKLDVKVKPEWIEEAKKLS